VIMQHVYQCKAIFLPKVSAIDDQMERQKS
jgi:hypothetical protein